SPQRQSCAHLVEVSKSIVDAGYPTQNPRHMVEQPLNHMRRHAKAGKSRGDRAAKIVQGEFLYVGNAPETIHRLGKTTKTSAGAPARGEHKFVVYARHASENFQRFRR